MHLITSAWVQEDDCNWGGTGGGGGGANPFILLHVMLKNYDTITRRVVQINSALINSLGMACKSA